MTIRPVDPPLSDSILLHRLRTLGDDLTLHDVRAILSRLPRLQGALRLLLADRALWRKSERDPVASHALAHAARILGMARATGAMDPIIRAIDRASRRQDSEILGCNAFLLCTWGPPAADRIVQVLRRRHSVHAELALLEAAVLPSLDDAATRERVIRRIVEALRRTSAKRASWIFCDLLDTFAYHGHGLAVQAAVTRLPARRRRQVAELLEVRERQDPDDREAMAGGGAECLMEHYDPERKDWENFFQSLRSSGECSCGSGRPASECCRRPGAPAPKGKRGR